MRVLREIEYDVADVQEITRAAVLADASMRIGTPGEGEEWKVHIMNYCISRISIEKVEPPKPEDVDDKTE